LVRVRIGSVRFRSLTATGGFTIRILYRDALATADYVLRRLENRQTLLIKNLFESKNFTFYVDHTTTTLNIDVTSTRFLYGLINLIDLNGKQFRPEPIV
jgi:hypothetical protein